MLEDHPVVLAADPADRLSDQERYEHEVIDDRLGVGWHQRVVIFGTGQIGLKTLHGLRQMGVEPVAFADNASHRWGRFIDGVEVLSPEGLAAEIPDARVIVAAWRSAAVVDQLRRASIDRAVSFKALFWHRPDLFLPHMRLDLPSRMLAAATVIDSVKNALGDAASREEFTRQIDWLGSFESYPLTIAKQEEQYFAFDLYAPRDDDVFIDCGAYDGDTIVHVLKTWPTGVVVHALEPDPVNGDALTMWRNSLPSALRQQVHLHPFASSDHRGSLRFSSAGPGSAISASGDLIVQAVTLDELFADTRTTFIKMDIEGAEPAALRGARQVLQRDQPIVAACLYHAQEHLWEVPALLMTIEPSYRLFIRRYGDEYGDVVCYAIPPERLVR